MNQQASVKRRNRFKKSAQLFHYLLLGTTCSTMAHGMWDDPALVRARDLETCTPLVKPSAGKVSATQTLDLEEKQLLTLAILEATHAEPNEADRAWTMVKELLENPQFQSQCPDILKQKLQNLQPRLLQPEALLWKDALSEFLACSSPDKNHSALAPLVHLIEELKEKEAELKQNDALTPFGIAEVLFALRTHYEHYIERLLHPYADRVSLTHPKAILSGEGLMNLDHRSLSSLSLDSKSLNPRSLDSKETCLHEIHSYRITQDMARDLLSKDKYGLFLKKNTSGSHAVCRKGSVHFKGNTTSTGLPVGKESAAYWLMKILFGEGMAPTALLTLNEVEIKTPPHGTQVRADHGLALATGKTGAEFIKLYPHHQHAFTEQNSYHILQAGLHVEGISLEDFMKGASPENVESGQYTYADLDLNSFSQHVIMSLLTNPADGTPGNFMLRRYKDSGSTSSSTQDKFFIVGIDNDMAFGPPIVSTKVAKDTYKPSLEVKNVLYCLPLMDESIDQATYKKVLEASPELILLKWLERLQNQQAQYDHLKERGYTKEGKTTPHLRANSYAEELHLPLQFTQGMVRTLLDDFTKLQDKLRSRPSITHNQLFSYLQPLAHRFYEALNHQYKTPLEAYQYIHNSTHENIYLEDVLSLEERLLDGQTIGAALREVQPIENNNTQTLANVIQELLATTDLFQLPSLTEVSSKEMPSKEVSLREGSLREFVDCSLNLLEGMDPNMPLHPSWSKDALLFKMISEKASARTIQRLLKRGLNGSITDPERRTTLRLAIESCYSPSVLKLLRDAYQGDQFLTWLNTIASDRLTALDRALETRQLENISTLIDMGASCCSPTIALKFYRAVIRGGEISDEKDPSQALSRQALLRQAFINLMQVNDEVRWHVCLEEMLPAYQSGQPGTPLLTANFSKRLMPNWVKAQILDSGNDSQDLWIPYTQAGNHLVCRATIPQGEQVSRQVSEQTSEQAPKRVSGLAPGQAPGQALYFKVYPELPGIEQAVGLFTQRLLGFGAPHTEMVNMNTTPVLISHSHGDKTQTVEHILRTTPHLLNDLDDESLSGLLLVAMLINPEDGKPSNYVIEDHPTKPGKYRIVGIDNDHAFVPAIVMEKPQKKFDISSLRQKPVPVAQVKTILYCLNQMKDSVHPNIRTLFINLRPDEFLEEWLRELKKINVSYNELFPNSNDHNRFFKEHGCFLGVPFQRGAISHLYDKFVTLRDALNEFPNITHLDLLMRVEPLLAKRYKAASLLPTVRERWDASDAGFYEKTKTGSGTTMTKSGDILRSMNIPIEESVFESIRKGNDSGPIQALQELKKIKQELTAKILEGLGARVDPNILKTLQLESTRAQFLEKTDFKTMPLKQQEAVLSYLATKKPQTLILKNCGALNDSVLTTKLSLSHLHKLDVRGCEGVTYRSLVHVSRVVPNLQELNLGGIQSLIEMGDIGAFTDGPLIFNNLRFLNLNNCINLVKLLIQAPNLHYLNIENCSKLTDQMLDGVVEQSEKLQKLEFEGCTLIGEREMRVQRPNFPAKYWEDVEKREFLIKTLDHKGSELNFNYDEIDRSPKGLMAFEKALRINVHFSNLTSLYLWNKNIGIEGVKALLKGNLTALTSLNLDGNDIGDEGTKALSNGNLTALTSLNLGWNKIGAEGMKSLSNGNLTALTVLGLGNNAIGDEGAIGLSNGNLTALTSLNLWNNNIGNKGAKVVAKGNLTALTLLSLRNNNIGAEGAKVVAKGNLTALTLLSLRNNNIGAEGAIALSNGNLTALTSLDLAHNNIGAEGAKALSKGNLTALTSLDLAHNNIWSEGAKALANGNLSALTSLRLEYNNIGDEAKEALKQRYPNARIYYF